MDQIHAVLSGLLDLFYPPRCPGCGRMGSLFCEKCRAQIQFIESPCCRRCGRPLPQSGLCPGCQGVLSHLDGIMAVAVFAEPLRQAIHSLKYENGVALAAPLGAIMTEAWHRLDLPAADLILPVPLHGRRLAERGYNQSALLAGVLGRGVGVPVDEHLLSRHRATIPQVGLSQQQRQQNVENAFACRNGLLDKAVVVVDDVCTTGATLEACAQVLRDAGAMSVWGFTLARARWDADQASEAPGIGFDGYDGPS